jgi:arylsulfatase A-like enzyme
MKFTQAYAAHPVCSPTRTSMMTGKNPARTHIDDWVGHGQSSNQYLRSPQWASKGLQPGDGNVTLPSLLAKKGYRCIHIGKAHFGGRGTPGADPLRLGFEVNIAGSHNGGPYGGWISPWRGKYKSFYPNLQDRPEGEYLTDAITIKAIDILDQAIKDKDPFFLNMAQFAVHAKISPAPDFIQGYQDGRPKVEAAYASMLEAMDASLGSILAKLRDPNGDGDPKDSVAENTLVFFMSDNGGLSNHSRSRKGEVRLADGVLANFQKDFHNKPLKSGKGSAYEGGIRVPMIVAWAGQAPQSKAIHPSLPILPGATCSEPVHMDDFFPTILDLRGIPNPLPKESQDGQSILPLLRGKTFHRRKGLYWHYPHQWYGKVGVGLGIEPFSALRKGPFKLILFYGDGVNDGQGPDPRMELYDLSHDLGETKNLVSSQPLKAKAMREQLINWLKKVGAGIPICKDSGMEAAFPACPR